MNRNISYNVNKLIESGGLTFLSCLLCVIIIPVHVDFLPPFMILWLACWIIENRKRFNKIWNRDDPVILLLLALHYIFSGTWFVYSLRMIFIMVYYWYSEDCHLLFSLLF